MDYFEENYNDCMKAFEGYFFGANASPATEIFGSAGRNKVRGLSDKEVVAEFLKAYGASNDLSGSTKAKLDEVSENSRKAEPDYEKDVDAKVVACGAGFAVVETMKDGSDIIVNFVRTKGTNVSVISFGLRDMRSYLAKVYEKQAKAAN